MPSFTNYGELVDQFVSSFSKCCVLRRLRGKRRGPKKMDAYEEIAMSPQNFLERVRIKMEKDLDQLQLERVNPVPQSPIQTKINGVWKQVYQTSKARFYLGTRSTRMTSLDAYSHVYINFAVEQKWLRTTIKYPSDHLRGPPRPLGTVLHYDNGISASTFIEGSKLVTIERLEGMEMDYSRILRFILDEKLWIVNWQNQSFSVRVFERWDGKEVYSQKMKFGECYEEIMTLFMNGGFEI